MRKLLFFLLYIITCIVFTNGCSTHTENGIVHRYGWGLNGNGENTNVFYSSVMSEDETQKLREIFASDTGWSEVECCVCAKYDIGYDLILDDTCYRICYNSMIYDEVHPISCKKLDGEFEYGLLHEDEEVMWEIFNVVFERSNERTAYEVFMEENKREGKQATLRHKSKLNEDGELVDNPDKEGMPISKEDTDRLRILLSLESGWKQTSSCFGLGKYELVLDNVLYIIDTSSVDCQVKYTAVDDYLTYGFENDNKEVVQEIYDIVEKYIKYD